MILEFAWTMDRQAFRADETLYIHLGSTPTAPSHDVAHLILAAGSRLPWVPRGSDLGIAEFNALFLEHLCHWIMMNDHDPISKTKETAQWFLEEYYKSLISISFADALERFRDGLDVESVLRLSPILFRQRAYEMANSEFYLRNYKGRFMSTDAPIGACKHVCALAGCITDLLKRPVSVLHGCGGCG